jgi:hypothetical protein
MHSRLLIASLTLNLMLSLVALGWLAWVVVDPVYWLGRPEQGQRGEQGVAGLPGPEGPPGERGPRGPAGRPAISAQPRQYDDTELWSSLASIEARLNELCSHQLLFREPTDPGTNYFLARC